MTHPPSRHAPDRTRRRFLTGGILWFSVVQYFAMLPIVRSAWTLPFDPVHNAISDLGAADCGVFAGRDVCSPWYLAANTSWVITGACVAAGAILLRPLLPRTLLAHAGFALAFIAGIAEVLVGLNPEDTSPTLHNISAITAIYAGGVGITLVSFAIRHTAPVLAALGGVVVLGVIAATALLVADVGGGEYFGLVERIGAFPILIWIIAAGTAVILRTVRARRYRTRSAETP